MSKEFRHVISKLLLFNSFMKTYPKSLLLINTNKILIRKSSTVHAINHNVARQCVLVGGKGNIGGVRTP